MSNTEAVPSPCQPLAPELSLYRDQCLVLLHRYFMMSVEVGRLPALLGREVFRTRARSYRLMSFEDIVIFVHDVEGCLRRLSAFDQELITRLVFQEYTQEEAVALMGCGLRTIERRFPEALDALTEMFLEYGMLNTATRHYRRPPAVDPPNGFNLEACAAIAELHNPGCELQCLA